MQIDVMCSRNCGHTVAVTDTEIMEHAESGLPLDAKHEVCPTPLDTEQPEYGYMIVVTRQLPGDMYPKRIAKTAGRVHADTFVDAMPLLSKEIEEGWERVQEMQEIVESGDVARAESSR